MADFITGRLGPDYFVEAGQAGFICEQLHSGVPHRASIHVGVHCSAHGVLLRASAPSLFMHSYPTLFRRAGASEKAAARPFRKPEKNTWGKIERRGVRARTAPDHADRVNAAVTGIIEL